MCAHARDQGTQSSITGTRKRDLGQGTGLKVRPWFRSWHWAGGLLPPPTVNKAETLSRVVGENTSHLDGI